MDSRVVEKFQVETANTVKMRAINDHIVCELCKTLLKLVRLLMLVK